MSSDAPLGATPGRPAIEKKRPELADIFALHGEVFHRDYPLPSRHLNVMRRLLLKLLFDCVAETLVEFGRGELGGQVGFTSVLHTWDQQLRPNFHLHVLIASGALVEDKSATGDASESRARWVAGGAAFLFPVRALSKKFRGKFLARFDELLQARKLRLAAEYASGAKPTRALLRKLRKKLWVIYSKPPFAGPAKLLD